MESVLSRYKNLIVLGAILMAQILGLAVQVKRASDAESSRLIRIWAVSAVTPFEKAISGIRNGSWNLWHNYVYLRGVRAENRALKQQIEQLRLEQTRLSEDANQARRLQVLLAFREQYVQKTVPAQVIGTSGSEQSRTVFVDKGKHDGVEADMAVITADGIVGKVLAVYPSTSQVLLLNDQSSGVGAVLEKSRLQGIVKGNSSGVVTLEYVMSDEQVPAGERVLTSGGDGIFPKGLPIGTVAKVSPGHELFLNIRVEPSANLAKLEEVLIVTEVVAREPATVEAGPVKAVDILAERLPSVPEKAPEASGNATGGTTAVANPTATPATGASSAAAPGAVKSSGTGTSPVTEKPKAPKPAADAAATTAADTAVVPKVPPAKTPTSAAAANAIVTKPAVSNGTPAKPAPPKPANATSSAPAKSAPAKPADKPAEPPKPKPVPPTAPPPADQAQ